MMTSHANLTLPNLLCCICGVPIQHNPTNMCINCLHDQIDITEGINKRVSINSCRTCGRFLGPPWQSVALESKELMIMCLRKINGLQNMKVVDAVWVWTEPHSLRLKIKLTVQKEVMNGAVLQQATIVEFLIRNQQCKHCESSFAQGAWEAIVQVRQRVSHKRTFFYLEQLILKHRAHAECVKIVTFRDGIDFYFKDKNQGLRFIDFLKGNITLKSKYSRKLISADHSSNTAEFKHNYLIEIVPICKDDLLLLPKELAAKQSNISPLVLVKRIGASIYVIDPLTSERTEINAEKYWRYSFLSLLNSRQLIKYVVLSVEPIVVEQRPSARMRKKYFKQQDGDNVSIQTESVRVITKLAECVVARERDFGVTDTQFTCITHLGPLLQPGDTVLAYDLTNTNLNIGEEGMKSFDLVSKNLPDVILVRKCYDRERNWTLKNLKTEGNYEEEDILDEKEQQGYDADKEVFLQQLEGDREMRANILLFKKSQQEKVNKKKVKKDAYAMETDEKNTEEEDLDEEEIRLDELLDDMTLSTDLLLASSSNGQKNVSSEEGREIAVISAEELQQQLETVSNPPVETTNNVTFDSSPFEGKTFKFL